MQPHNAIKHNLLGIFLGEISRKYFIRNRKSAVCCLLGGVRKNNKFRIFTKIFYTRQKVCCLLGKVRKTANSGFSKIFYTRQKVCCLLSTFPPECERKSSGVSFNAIPPKNLILNSHLNFKRRSQKVNQRATASVYQNNTWNSSIPKFTGFENASLVKRIWIFTEQSLPSSLVCETKGLIWEAREPSHSLLCIETQKGKDNFLTFFCAINYQTPERYKER